jgi:tRNA A-37 threonylcarbamoyl transferase component Bud32
MERKQNEYLFGYRIIKYLGKGKSAYSYLIEYEGKLAVLKHIHYELIDLTYDLEENKLNHELRSYKQLEETKFLFPKLLFYDDENQYLIKEYIEGELLLDYISKGEIDLNIYVDILYAIYSAENNNMNIDYFPTNFMLIMKLMNILKIGIFVIGVFICG